MREWKEVGRGKMGGGGEEKHGAGWKENEEKRDEKKVTGNGENGMGRKTGKMEENEVVRGNEGDGEGNRMT